MDNRPITALTVSELEDLIKRTVEESVTRVMIEFAMEADAEAQFAYEAELAETLRAEMRAAGRALDFAEHTRPKADD